jgi:hypothetical protein
MLRRLFNTSPITLLVIVLLQFACGGGDSGPGPVETPQFGTLTGIVRDPAGAAIAAATVSVGTNSTTSSASGNFELRNVAIGNATLTVNAAGFDTYSQAVGVQLGSNTHNVSLVRRTVYDFGEFAAFLPSTLATVRGVFFLMAGSDSDSRAFVRGAAVCWAYQGPGGVCGNDPDYRVRLLALAQKHGLIIFGLKTLDASGQVAPNEQMIAALAGVAEQSGHPEINGAPIILVGSSLGGCRAHAFASARASRVIGFMTAKGACHSTAASPASTVPAYLFIGEEDPVSPTAIVNITDLFLANRAAGANWAVAIDAGSGHEPPQENDMTFGWLDAILTRRLPAGYVQGAPLPVIAEASGWLANRTTKQIASYACYPGDKSTASWLPSEQTARDWQTMVGGSPNVIACP